MTTVQEEDVGTETGRAVGALAQRLLSTAQWDRDYSLEQRNELLQMLLPRTLAESPMVALSAYFGVLQALQNARYMRPTARRVWRGEAAVHALNAARHELMGTGWRR